MDATPRKTNIALLTDCLGDITGGAEKQIFELGRRLPKERYNVFIVSLEAVGTTSRPLIESIGCRLKIFRVVRIYGVSGLREGLKFLSFLRRNAIDVLVTYHFGSDIWGTFWAHSAGVPLIVSNRRDMGFWRKNHQLAAYRLINPWVHKIVAVTSSVKQMVMDTEGLPGDKIAVIYNGVEFSPSFDGARQQRDRLKLKADDIVVIHVANLRPVKGHIYLIEAFAKVIVDYPKASLVLIGKDGLKGQLQDLAKKLEIESRILFLGQRNDVSKLLDVADIAVLPSLSEGMSNAILEYMAHGLPVIATRVGGNPELVQDGFNGLLVEKENVEQLKEALLQLLIDKDKRRTMGQNGLFRVKEEFSMEAMMAQYERLFQGR